MLARDETVDCLDSYRPAAGVRALTLAGRSLIHVEDRQQVLELSHTAERIWRALAAGRSARATVREIAPLAASEQQAAEFVADAVSQWTVAGYLAPRALDAALARDPDQSLVLDELVIELRLVGVGRDGLNAVFGHLIGAASGTRRRLTIIAHDGKLLFYVERTLVSSGKADALVPVVKALLTEIYIDTVDDGFLAHGALMLHGGRSVMLSGVSGAGKTTLALALAALGWSYGGDDIVRVWPDGSVQGLPFAAAVKAGAAPLLARAWPQLDAQREWVRGDGKTVRYLTPPNLAAGSPRPLSVLVRVTRRDGAVARLRPLSPVDALSAVVETAYARRWRMTGEAFCALAGALERAVCVELEYSDLGAAAAAIGEVVGVQAEVA